MFHGIWILYANISEHSVCSEASAYKIQMPGNFPEAYKIQNVVKVWNKET